MKVARIHAPGDVRISEEPVPQVGEGESLVRVGAVGLCGSDLHWFHSGGIGDAVLDQPLVLGHEFAGVVDGGDLDGRVVAVDPARPCYSCRECDEGHRNLCTRVKFAGHGKNDGGLRQYVAWPTELLYPLPADMDSVGGALLEPLGVAIHAWDLAKVRLADRVAIVGCGPIGLLLIRLARAAGVSSVVAVEPRAHRREAALDAGASLVLDPVATDYSAAATAAAEAPIDVVIEASNHPDGAQLAIDLVKVGGMVVLAGIPDDDRTTFQAATARRKGLTIKTSRRMGEVYERAIALVAGGLVEISSLATHTFGFDEIDQAFAQAQDRVGLKVIIDPWGSSGD